MFNNFISVLRKSSFFKQLTAQGKPSTCRLSYLPPRGGVGDTCLDNLMDVWEKMVDIVQLCGLWSSPVGRSDQIWHLLSNLWFKY